MNGTVFFNCSTSAISAIVAALRIPAWLAAPKRGEEDAGTRGRRKIVAKSKLMALNLCSTVSSSSSSSKDPIAPKGPGKLTTSGKNLTPGKREILNPEAASSSQVRLQDAHLGGLMKRVAGRLAVTNESQVLWEISESGSWSNHEKESTGDPVAHEKVTGKLVASIKSENEGNLKAESRKWPHNFHLSSAMVPRAPRYGVLGR